MQTCVGFANGFLSVGSWVFNTLWTKAMGGVSDRGGHCFVSHLSLIGFGSRNGDMSEVVLLASFHPGSV